MGVLRLNNFLKYKYGDDKSPLILTVDSPIVQGDEALKLYIYQALLRSASARMDRRDLIEILPSIWEVIQRAEVLSGENSIRLAPGDRAKRGPVGKLVNARLYHSLPPRIRNLPGDERPWPYGEKGAQRVRVFSTEEEYSNRPPPHPNAPQPRHSSSRDRDAEVRSRTLGIIAGMCVGGVIGVFIGQRRLR